MDLLDVSKKKDSNLQDRVSIPRFSDYLGSALTTTLTQSLMLQLGIYINGCAAYLPFYVQQVKRIQN
jgi:hypothetical protein